MEGGQVDRARRGGRPHHRTAWMGFLMVCPGPSPLAQSGRAGVGWDLALSPAGNLRVGSGEGQSLTPPQAGG